MDGDYGSDRSSSSSDRGREVRANRDKTKTTDIP